MAKMIKLIFDGYFDEKTLPTRGHRSSGVYTVYAGSINPFKECEFRELLYIGEADDVVGKITSTIKAKKGLYQDWKQHLKKDEILIFAIADVDVRDREQAAAALIYFHYNYGKLKIPCNRQHKESFQYASTKVFTFNRNKFFRSEFLAVDA